MNTRNNQIKKDIAKMITTAMKENGTDFMQSWVKLGMPKNIRGTNYSGVNIFSLWFNKEMNNYQSNTWATFNQIKKLGGNVIKGSKGTYVQGWFSYANKKVNSKGDEVSDAGIAPTFYKVFNLDQTDLDEKKVVLPNEAETLIAVEEYVKNTGAHITHETILNGKPEACYYHPFFDQINMANKDKFFSSDDSTATENYYAVLLHELTHWTGHSKRCNRPSITEKGIKENDYTHTYAFEELIAEIGSAIQCCTLGISSGIKPSSAKYLNAWIKRIDDNPQILFHACAKANQAVNFIEKKQNEKLQEVA